MKIRGRYCESKFSRNSQDELKSFGRWVFWFQTTDKFL